MSRGVIYLFCGPRTAERTVVSLASLRQHYSGPATIFVTDETLAAIIRPAAEQLDVAVAFGRPATARPSIAAALCHR